MLWPMQSMKNTKIVYIKLFLADSVIDGLLFWVMHYSICICVKKAAEFYIYFIICKLSLMI
jgi:hypothetical protein